MLVIDTNDDVTLVLDGTTFYSEGLPCIYSPGKSEVTIEFVNDNTLTNTGDYAAIYVHSDLNVTGDGACDVTSESHAFQSKDNLICDGEFTLTATAATDCMHAGDDMTIESGNYVLTSTGDECIQAGNDLTINGGTLNCTTTDTDAIKAENKLTINDGNITVNSGNEGIESKNEIEINGGTINVTTTDDCINAANSIVITDGVITAYSSTNDCIDSNGSIEITGGTIYAVGLTVPEGALDCDNGNFIISGGTIIGLGSINSTPTSAKQNVLLIGSNDDAAITNVTNITIKDESGDVIISQDVDASMSTIQSGAKMTQDAANTPADMEQAPTDNANSDAANETQMTPPQGGMEYVALDDSTSSDMQTPPEKPEGDNSDTNMPNANNDMVQGDLNRQGGAFNNNGGGISNSEGVNFIISTNKLKMGSTYTVYINNEEYATVTIEEGVTTSGTLSTMGGGAI